MRSGCGSQWEARAALCRLRLDGGRALLARASPQSSPPGRGKWNQVVGRGPPRPQHPADASPKPAPHFPSVSSAARPGQLCFSFAGRFPSSSVLKTGARAAPRPRVLSPALHPTVPGSPSIQTPPRCLLGFGASWVSAAERFKFP